MNAVIIPSKLKGKVIIPPSKSLAHRAIICASLADGVSIISNVAMSDDIIATIECMRALGADIKTQEKNLEITGVKDKLNKDLQLDCNESGSTLRFMLPIALCVNKGYTHFVGRGKLGQRPMSIYQDICRDGNIEYIDKSMQNPFRYLDLTVKGELTGGEYVVDGSVSSQFITGLLFALPMLNKDSKIIIDGQLQSKGYIDLTLTALRQFGIEIKSEKYKTFYIKGNQKYLPSNYFIEGDYSQSAFYEVANFLGSDIEMIGLDNHSLQGDKVIEQYVERLRTASAKESLIFDGENCPDIIPVFALACCMRKGHTDIVNLSRLRIKECDRLKATAAELTKLGAKIKEGEDFLAIDGVDFLTGGVVDSHGDHRMAMMLSIASLAAKDKIKINGAHSVSKSYPNFFDDFAKLGGKVKIIQE